MSLCRSCGAEIVWARSTKTGTLGPYDIEETADGRFALEERVAEPESPNTGAHASETVARYTGAGRGHASHFATCPDAPSWRRPR
jgi:hypothetical protein